MRKTTNYNLSLYDKEDKFIITNEENSLNANMELIDNALKNKADTSEIPAKTSQLQNDSLYATETYVKNQIANAQLGGGGEVDLSGYATKDEIPTKVSQLTNDSGFITSYTEVDPTVPDYVKAITQADINKWNNNSEGSGLTTEQINALNEMFKVCAYVKEDVSTEYGAFKTAFGIEGESGGGTVPTKTLQSISATYTGGNVKVGTNVNALTGITVKANYSDGTSTNVTGYTLSGAIVEGDNTITVTYQGITTTFIVTGIVEFSPFKFIQLSDTHYQYSQNATTVVVDNINDLSDVDFVTNSGDITLDQTKDDATKIAELTEYKTNFKDKLNIPIYPCVGGHDLCTNTDEIWRTYTGTERLHELRHKDCVFLFADCLLTGWLEWLETKVASYTGKRIFIFEHHPIENDEFTVGLKEGETRCTWSETGMAKILDILRNNRNIIWFTGHTHWAFGTAVNDVFNDNGLMSTIVHTPYLNAYQGWEINVNDNDTILKGVSFSETGMTYLGDSYNYTIKQDVVDYGESKILTDGESVSVNGTTEISVYLESKPTVNQIVKVMANDGISANVTQLTFTPSNYNTPQKVIVTGIAEGIGKLTLSSNSKTSVRKIDVTASGTSTIINWFNKDKPLTLLGSYYGTGSSASYQLSNLIPARTGDTVKSTALGSQTTYRLKLFDANFNYIAETQNNVQAIDYTIVEPNVEYVSVVYRGSTAGQADSIMVTVNQDLPSAYIAYNGEPVGYTITNYAKPDSPSVTSGYYNSHLTRVDDGSVNVSNIIPCNVGDTVYSNSISSTADHIYLFDENKTIIERLTKDKNTISNGSAKYFAVSYLSSKANEFMITINQKLPGYYVAESDVM